MLKNQFILIRLNQRKPDGSWSGGFGFIFNVASFIHKYRIFRLWRKFSAIQLRSLGILFGRLFLANNKTKNKIFASIDALYGMKISLKKRKQIYYGNVQYIGHLFLDAMLHSPNIYHHTLHEFITFKNIKYLDEILEAGNGVIINSLHVGMFFHLIAGLTYHPKKYEIMTIVQPNNQVLYENIVNRSDIPNLRTVPSTSFNESRQLLLDHLNNNGILIVLHDYSKLSHFRAPFYTGKYKYLVTTPQSAIRLHKITKAPLMVALLHPDRELGRSIIDFIDPNSLKSISEKYFDKDEREFHGSLSTELNRLLSPHIIKYPHMWEEIQNFSLRIGDNFEIPKKIEVSYFLTTIFEKMKSIMENSFEPNRDDLKISSLIIKYKTKINECIVNPKNEIDIHGKEFLDLSHLNAIQEIVKLLVYAKSILQGENEISCANLMDTFKKEIKNIE